MEYPPTVLILPGDKVLCNDMRQVWSFQGEAEVTGLLSGNAWVVLKISATRQERLWSGHVRLVDGVEAQRRLAACQSWHASH